LDLPSNIYRILRWILFYFVEDWSRLIGSNADPSGTQDTTRRTTGIVNRKYSY
jgi:hypothetical protein